MIQDYFFLAEKIRADSKYFDVSIEEILRHLENEGGKFEYKCEQVFEGFANPVPLRLNIRCKGPVNSWTISLKLPGTIRPIRIDCIDWEARYTDVLGQSMYGWHRHMFDDKSKSAENLKASVEGLDDISNKQQFLFRAFKLMKILLNEVDYGSTELPFH